MKESPSGNKCCLFEKLMKMFGLRFCPSILIQILKKFIYIYNITSSDALRMTGLPLFEVFGGLKA